MTMTAICVKEIATGVPSKPNEALSNFRPEHPGTLDGWKLASTHDGNDDGEQIISKGLELSAISPIFLKTQIR